MAAVVQGVNDPSAWLNHQVTIMWTVTDDSGDGIAAPASILATTEGEHTYRSAEVCDSAGNCATGEITLKLDTTAPVVTPRLADTLPLTAWRNHDTTIAWQVSDNLDQSIPTPADTLATLEGTQLYTSPRVCDHAGNCTTGTTSLSIDKTAPTTGELSWTVNPKKTTDISRLTVPVGDTVSGIVRGEYFIGDNDPGQGNGAPMSLSDNTVGVDQTTDYATGVYTVSVRVQDAAGNWSLLSTGYLVVYDPTSGATVRGQRTVTITPSYATYLPWLSGPTPARFGFSVKYNRDGTIAKQSDLQFAYTTGLNCKKPAQAVNCHSFELNATSIAWLTISDTNQSLATFKASATLTRDGVSQPVTVIVQARDGTRLDATSDDNVSLP